MAKTAATQIVTANHLTEGHSVFLTKQGWSANHHQALIASGKDAAAALEKAAKVDEDLNLVIGVYLVDVALDDAGRPEPTHYREKMRVRARPSFWADDPVLPMAVKPARAFIEAAHVSL
jgi:Protein of unknown function (DUF2849)